MRTIISSTPLKHHELLEHVKYDEGTGVFTRKQSAGNTKAGSVIGSLDKKGYLKALVLGKYVKLHRLAWFYVYGVWPREQIDHLNNIKTDNRIANLRDCDTATNCLNQRSPRKNNILGVHGVHQIKKTGRFRVCCSVQGQRYDLGIFLTIEEASAAYQSFKAPHIPKLP